MKRTRLKSKETGELLQIHLTKKDTVELREEQYTIIFINDKPAFFYYREKPVPTLRYLQEHPDFLKKIIVDLGAVKFIVNGADVMRPGITEIADGIKKDDYVVVVDAMHKKALMVGIALFPGEEMQKMRTGKVIKNIHYVGDEIWKTVS